MRFIYIYIYITRFFMQWLSFLGSIMGSTVFFPVLVSCHSIENGSCFVDCRIYLWL